MVIKFSEEQRLNAVKLYREGKSVSEVEQLTGISANYVKNLLKKYGIQTRPAGFQKGNTRRKDKLHSQTTKEKISNKHKSSGHKPSPEAARKGQPLSLKSTWKDHVKDPVAQLIRIYKDGARKRSLDYFLTREEFEAFIYKPCYYCAEPPGSRNVNGCDLVCNGIDRVNNTIGYIQSNCITSCKLCNKMKSSMSEQEFTDHCCKIASRFISGLVRFIDD